MGIGIRPALYLMILALCVAPASVFAVTEYYPGSFCTMDSDSVADAEDIYLWGGEYRNSDVTNDALITCSVPMYAGTAAADFLDLWVYDGNNDSGDSNAVSAILYWHDNDTHGSWESCGEELSNSTTTFTGNDNLSWNATPGIETMNCLVGHSIGYAFITVVLPDADVDDSGITGFVFGH